MSMCDRQVDTPEEMAKKIKFDLFLSIAICYRGLAYFRDECLDSAVAQDDRVAYLQHESKFNRILFLRDGAGMNPQLLKEYNSYEYLILEAQNKASMYRILAELPEHEARVRAFPKP